MVCCGYAAGRILPIPDRNIIKAITRHAGGDRYGQHGMQMIDRSVYSNKYVGINRLSRGVMDKDFYGENRGPYFKQR